MVDPRWRRFVESLRRAGFGHVAKPHASVWEEAIRKRKSTTDEPRTVPEKPSISAADIQTKTELPPASGPLHRIGEPLLPVEEKIRALEVLATNIKSCRLCPSLVANRTQTVFSDGTPNAELCFLGEAPGADEDLQGVPFVGKAGQLLTKMIEACKLTRQEVYICNVLKCRPPENRNPEWEEMVNCREHLRQQLGIVRPKAIFALGKFAAAFLLDRRPDQVFITKIRGTWAEFAGIPVMISLHPAYLLRNPAAKKDAWEDMKATMRFLGKPIG